MTLAGDIVAASAIAIITAVFQFLVITMLGPDTTLYEMASSASNLNGAQRAAFWYKSLVLWVPLGVYVLCGTFPLVRAYRRQTATARVRP